MKFLKAIGREFLDIILTIISDYFLTAITIIIFAASALAGKYSFPFHVFWLFNSLLVFIVLSIVAIIGIIITLGLLALGYFIFGNQIRMNAKRTEPSS